MLSWEYPPKRVGGIAAALEGLAPALARLGVEVHVVTSGDAGGDPEESPSPNLHLHRVLVTEPCNDFVHWVHRLNAAMESRVDALVSDWAREPKGKTGRRPVVLHVHDWLGQFAGIALKHRYRLPMLSTIHATEYGRNQGIHTDFQRLIHDYEVALSHESWRVIVCSAFMRGEVGHALGTPDDKMDIVYNGVDGTVYDFPFPDAERRAFRDRFAAPHERLIYFIGRMVHEKGAQVLVEAMPSVLRRVPAKLVVAGGGARAHLEDQARRLGVADHIFFTGRISDADRDRLYRVADVAVYPSLYEPFGIVALEAMAAGVPVVVSNA
ncbi:MAG: glycosyltransferase family 4 protein, partial [Armatimonadota bacterium]